jgi:hypothetical protein
MIFTAEYVILPFKIQIECMNELPKDPMILFSVVNMKLRDCYSSLDELCDDMLVDKEELIKRLAVFGFEYDPDSNRFW